MVYPIFTIVSLRETFPKVSLDTQMDIVCKSYTLGKLTYQRTTLRFTKMLAFHLLGSGLGYIIFECMVFSLVTIFLLDDSSPIVSWATQINIVCKCYSLKKLTYELTTSRFIKLLAFHWIGWYLGYTISKGVV